MDNKDVNTDTLDGLIEKHRLALIGEQPVTPSAETITSSPTNDVNIPLIDEVDYGENDIPTGIENDVPVEIENKIEYEEPEEPMAPNTRDPNYIKEAIDFQTDKLAIVSMMVNKVIAKNRLYNGCIPENIKMPLMGELMECYHADGEVITPMFEKLIVDNWVSDEPTTTNDTTVTDTKTDTNTVVETKKETPTINITVEAGTPVTVNVDESIVAKTVETKEINIHVKEVSASEILSATIIENSEVEGIIKPYDSGINDVPITLPLSGYRCVISSINWFDFIKLTAPTSQNPSDNELKKWSVVYSHMKNISIGAFKDFDDFLKKTKYQDKELLMWALLVSTSDDEEILGMQCPNPKCKYDIRVPYMPRAIVHMDDSLVPTHYQKTATVAVGPEAIKHWDYVNNKRRLYTLPSTGIIVEINEPSAFEYITVKLPLIQELYERYRPGQSMDTFNHEDVDLMEFDYLAAHGLYISAITIVHEGKHYRYTKWEDLEKILTKSLNSDDSGVLFQIIGKAKSQVSPASFYIENIDCPSCKRHEDRINITDISNTLLFQVSRRLASTEINLIEQPQI